MHKQKRFTKWYKWHVETNCLYVKKVAQVRPQVVRYLVALRA